jgi:glycosyltransferase involved in cell wall biosynthesis
MVNQGGVKLIIQIPCLNEAESLPKTLSDIPRKIDGIEKLEVLIIDDGSTDNTSEIAKQNGVEHIIRFTKRKGLAAAFKAGIDASLSLGADIIVNTDADNQYKGSDIPNLIRPILEKRADLVIGNRRIDQVSEFSFIKKKLQKIGSWVVRSISNTNIADTTTGFRAYSKEAALKLNIISEFTYTLESIIQAGKKGLAIENIFIDINKVERKSRLFNSMLDYVKSSLATIIRIYAMFNPLRVFLSIAMVFFVPGSLFCLRFLYFFYIGKGSGHVQSLILAVALLIIGFQIALIGLVADVVSGNRRLIEDALERIKRTELVSKKS